MAPRPALPRHLAIARIDCGLQGHGSGTGEKSVKAPVRGIRSEGSVSRDQVVGDHQDGMARAQRSPGDDHDVLCSGRSGWQGRSLAPCCSVAGSCSAKPHQDVRARAIPRPPFDSTCPNPCGNFDAARTGHHLERAVLVSPLSNRRSRVTQQLVRSAWRRRSND